MVVGANGTGKSTILNAICLGLGGEPKVLGRADDLRAFIMHGKNEAMIEIELAPVTEHDEPHILQRYIDRNKGSANGRGRGASTFYVNGEKTTIQAVRELVVTKHNIQIDNLCTFLPQDKVGNFSGFTDQERLLETEKTLPTNQFFYKRHLQLIEKEESIDREVSDIETTKDALKRKKHEFERLEIGRLREEERVTAEAQVELLRKKRVWLEFEQMREEGVRLKADKDRVKNELRAAQQDIAPLEERLQLVVSSKLELEAKIKKLEYNIVKAEKEMDKQSKKYETHDDAMEAAAAELNALDSKRGGIERSLAEAKGRLKDLEEELASVKPTDELQQELRMHKEDVREARVQVENARKEDRTQKQQFAELEEKAGTLQQKFVKLSDDGARRRENVLRRSPNLAKICDWIDKNKSKFRRPVWGPIAVEVTTKSQNTAAYVEFHIPNTILKSFVVETDEDRVLLYSEIREKLNIPINVLNADGKQLETVRMYSNEKMKILKEQHGVECYLDETFAAPDPVMVALQKFANVHKVLVGAETTQDSIERRQLRDFLSEPDSSLGQTGLQGSCIFAAKGNQSYRYIQSVSSYSGKVNSKMDYVGPAKMLAPGVSEEQKARVEDELKGIHEEIAGRRPRVLKAEKAFAELESSVQQKHALFSSIKTTLEHVKKNEGKMQRLHERIVQLEKDLSSDNNDEKKNLTEDLLKRLKHSIAAITAHGDQQGLMVKNTICMAGISVNRTALNSAERLAR
jgi:structural maintenance of chromosomes protein 5